jgi:hypothetical protein
MDGITKPDFLEDLAIDAKKALCRGCPVQYACLEFALEVEANDYGLLHNTDRVGIVYGGLDGRERQELLRRQRAAA